jgi:hypothetical protein
VQKRAAEAALEARRLLRQSELAADHTADGCACRGCCSAVASMPDLAADHGADRCARSRADDIHADPVDRRGRRSVYDGCRRMHHRRPALDIDGLLDDHLPLDIHRSLHNHVALGFRAAALDDQVLHGVMLDDHVPWALFDYDMAGAVLDDDMPRGRTAVEHGVSGTRPSVARVVMGECRERSGEQSTGRQEVIHCFRC